MADLNKAVGIDHYYAIGVRNGVNRFDVAYTSDEAIAVAVFADHEIADKVGKRLIDSHMASTTMNGSIIDPAFYVAYSCPPISGETLNGWFKEGVL